MSLRVGLFAVVDGARIVFTSEKYITVATWGLVLVTLALVIVTALLVWDGSRKSREQRERWAEEDKRSENNAAPSAVIEITTNDNADLIFGCFNLGNNTFFVDKMIVTARDGTIQETTLTPKIVTPGTYAAVGYDPAQIMGLFGENTEFKEANAVFVLKGATGTVQTDPAWFYVFYRKNGVGCGWNIGRLADRQPGTLVPVPKRLPHLAEQAGNSAVTGGVVDEYGNNAAVRCAECGEVFVFSKHLNKEKGRVCPHCKGWIAKLTVDEIQVDKNETG
jgi:hypothetical protein